MSFFAKPAGDGKRTPWHQDGEFGQKAHVPERKVAADQLLDQVEDVAIRRRIAKSQVVVK